mmetsp:Transcript_11523/g.17278  ORF Transcript_11523/g.17278 Transcript_11523/m.17278 type:complete len:223 (-) Transcript_11523:47-715(-)
MVVHHNKPTIKEEDNIITLHNTITRNKRHLVMHVEIDPVATTQNSNSMAVGKILVQNHILDCLVINSNHHNTLVQHHLEASEVYHSMAMAHGVVLLVLEDLDQHHHCLVQVLKEMLNFIVNQSVVGKSTMEVIHHTPHQQEIHQLDIDVLPLQDHSTQQTNHINHNFTLHHHRILAEDADQVHNLQRKIKAKNRLMHHMCLSDNHLDQVQQKDSRKIIKKEE